MKRNLHLAVNNDTCIQLSLRDVTALNLCRNILEDCLPVYKDRYAMTPRGELITFESAVEILDTILEKNK